MKKLMAVPLLLLFCAFGQFQLGQRSFSSHSGGFSPIAPINSANAATEQCGGGTCTTAPANMSGATLLTVSVAAYLCPGSSSNVTDSNGNVYSQAVNQSNYPAICLYYKCGATVGPSMTFSVATPGGYATGFAVDGYSNVKASSCADGVASISGSCCGAASPVNTGTVTPSVDNDVCVAVGMGDTSSSPVVLFTTPLQSFTTLDQVSNGTDYSVFTGYFVQTTAATLSTTFTSSAGGSSFSSALQCFLHV